MTTGRSSDYDHLGTRGKLLSDVSIPLSDSPLDVVSNHRISNTFTDCNANTPGSSSYCINALYIDENHKIARRRPHAHSRNATKAAGTENPVRPLKAAGHRRHELLGGNCRRQPAATFCSSSTQDGSSGSSLHSRPEPVNPLSPNAAGLIRSFHRKCLLCSLRSLIPSESRYWIKHRRIRVLVRLSALNANEPKITKGTEGSVCDTNTPPHPYTPW